MEENYKTQCRQAIAVELISARKKAGFTQAQLAEKMNVTQPLIARLEQGKSNMSCDTLIRFADACGCVVRVKIVRMKTEKKTSK